MIVHCTPAWLDKYCVQSGLQPEQCREAIVGTEDGKLLVDATHPNYPKLQQQPRVEVESGPGTELKLLLYRWLGIQATPNCSCNARAAQMNQWGPEECEQRMEEILDWLAGEARVRGLPFVRLAARQMVRLAIRNARSKPASI